MRSETYNFYPQTGFSFIYEFTPVNNFFSGSIIFLNSGTENSINFLSGKINNHSGEFVSSRNQDQYLKISGNMSTNNFNYYINDKLIYIEGLEYGFCSGISIKSNLSKEQQNEYIRVYGDNPSYSITNDKEVYSNQPINLYISGSSNNFQNFSIYEIQIGGTLNQTLGNSNYVPRNYFSISGQNVWESGLSISPGYVYNLVLEQTDFIYSKAGGYIYIPMYMETSFGTSYFVIFVKILNEFDVETMYTRNITQKSELTAGFFIDFSFTPLKASNKDFFIYISGLNGNNFSNNGFRDTFTGSWTISIDDEEDFEFYPNIIETNNIEFFDSTNNLTHNIQKSGNYYTPIISENNTISGLSGITENQIQISSGIYNGLVFNVPYLADTTFKITGIDFGIYSTGIYTGLKTSQINSGISGANIYISMYEIDEYYKLKNKVNTYNLIFNNIYDTENNNANIFALTGIFDIYTNKNYALVLSGYSSGYMYGYNLFMPTGNLNYQNDYIQYVNSISGTDNNNSFTGIDKIPYFRLLGDKFTDKNILSGYGNLNFRDQNDNSTYKTISVLKIYNYNNNNNYTGSAFFYMSGYSGFQKSGYLSVYKNMFREIQNTIEIL